jgi:hypothetical protein
MRVATGKIVAGKVVLEGQPFEEGVTVAVIAADESKCFDLTPEQEAGSLKRLLRSIMASSSMVQIYCAA